MRVYHFISSKFGLQNIRRRQLKIATVGDLNDPFELLGPSQKEQEARRRFAKWRTDLGNYAGLLCFSRKWSNPVHWSHYADAHRGLCLGFDVPDERAMEVEYQARRMIPRMDVLDAGGPSAEEEAKRILTTKYAHWRYEAEVRIFARLEEADQTSGLYFVDFSDDLLLREVIVGHRSPVSRDQLRRALGPLARDIAICRARLAFGTFRIVRQRDEALWV